MGDGAVVAVVVVAVANAVAVAVAVVGRCFLLDRSIRAGILAAGGLAAGLGFGRIVRVVVAADAAARALAAAKVIWI